ncbi:hypothetical protein DFH07DRAFT_777794 [Mycena maculata]|uniref:Uncharacterized protein n=1 Tax=Mycena maculata TaxID=230809 RepID=A0AAD7N1C8_9AGAR|nr:hypothetical protein DFH07DRAFT_777794 [Mycena maculata]
MIATTVLNLQPQTKTTNQQREENTETDNFKAAHAALGPLLRVHNHLESTPPLLRTHTDAAQRNSHGPSAGLFHRLHALQQPLPRADAPTHHHLPCAPACKDTSVPNFSRPMSMPHTPVPRNATWSGNFGFVANYEVYVPPWLSLASSLTRRAAEGVRGRGGRRAGQVKLLALALPRTPGIYRLAPLPTCLRPLCGVAASPLLPAPSPSPLASSPLPACTAQEQLRLHASVLCAALAALPLLPAPSPSPLASSPLPACTAQEQPREPQTPTLRSRWSSFTLSSAHFLHAWYVPEDEATRDGHNHPTALCAAAQVEEQEAAHSCGHPHRRAACGAQCLPPCILLEASTRPTPRLPRVPVPIGGARADIRVQRLPQPPGQGGVIRPLHWNRRLVGAAGGSKYRGVVMCLAWP